MEIKIDRLTSDSISELINQHQQEMAIHSPQESRHVLGLKSLKKPGITFWSAWENKKLVGCVALKQLNSNQGEIKSMRATPQSRGKGVGKKLMEHIISVSKQRSYQALYLETGSMQAFEPAIKLYEKYGFSFCQPFADYKLDPNSVFMVLKLRN
jgi:putative acetyltransferase